MTAIRNSITASLYRNSFISVSTGSEVLWCDPWLCEANASSWSAAGLSNSEFLDIHGIPDYIYVSHIHDDHYDLSLIAEVETRCTPTYIIANGGKAFDILCSRIERSGVKRTQIIRPDILSQLNVGPFSIVILPQLLNSSSEHESSQIFFHIDTSILIQYSDIQIFNQTDNPYKSSQIAHIRNKLREIGITFEPDLSFIPYCAASWYPQNYCGLNREQIREDLMTRIFEELFLDVCNTIDSGVYVPAGGNYTLQQPYDCIDHLKAVPKTDELCSLVERLGESIKDKVLISDGEYQCSDRLLFIKHEESLGSSAGTEDSPEDDLKQIDYNLALDALNQAMCSLHNAFKHVNHEITIAIDIDKNVINSLKNGSIDISQKLVSHKAFGSPDVSLALVVPESVIYGILHEGHTWNSVGFKCALSREPNIFNPEVEILLNQVFLRLRNNLTTHSN